MQIIELDNMPEGNPFHHDASSVGMDLRDAVMNEKLKGFYIMSSSMNNKFDFYIVDSHTGERFGVKV